MQASRKTLELVPTILVTARKKFVDDFLANRVS
jgi:hypothetical protein